MEYVKDDHMVLVRDEENEKKLRDYFDRLHNNSFNQDLGDHTSQC